MRIFPNTVKKCYIPPVVRIAVNMFNNLSLKYKKDQSMLEDSKKGIYVNRKELHCQILKLTLSEKKKDSLMNINKNSEIQQTLTIIN